LSDNISNYHFQRAIFEEEHTERGDRFQGVEYTPQQYISDIVGVRKTRQTLHETHFIRIKQTLKYRMTDLDGKIN